MATDISGITSAITYHFRPKFFHSKKAISDKIRLVVFRNPLQRRCLKNKREVIISEIETDNPNLIIPNEVDKMSRNKSQKNAYLIAAIMSTFGITSMATVAVYYRFSSNIRGSEFPVLEMFGTLALSVGAAVGMELWGRWAHKELWHGSLWNMHESHHRPRNGAFELNDVFAIINAFPAIALLSFGFFNDGFLPCLCFGAGLGITVYGIAYMFVHDGLVHRRFPVGPIANVPYLRRVASAHHLHHTDKYKGVPYGLFLGPEELVKVGGEEMLEKEIQRRTKVSKH